MIKVRDFERALLLDIEELGCWTPSHIDQVTRRLREGEFLPRGGRGPHAPEMTSDHAANIILALMAADRAVDALDALDAYGPLQPAGGDLDPMDCRTFREALAAILSDADLAEQIESISVCRTWPEARIRANDWDQKYTPADRPETGYGKAVDVTVTVAGPLIQQLALLLSGDDAGGDVEGGWVGDLPPDHPLRRGRVTE